MTHKFIKMLLTSVIILFTTTQLFSQTRHININWRSGVTDFPGTFEGAEPHYYLKDKYFSAWTYTELSGQNLLQGKISNEVYEPISAPAAVLEYLRNVKFIEFINGEERGINRFKLKLIPYRIQNNSIERLISFDLSIDVIGKRSQPLNKKGNKTTSVLSSGDWFKIRIKEDGVYKLDKAFFKANGINTDNLNLATFKIFGNGGELLPEEMDVPRADDLLENAIKINDENANNKLDDGDFISFYANGPDSWVNNGFGYNHVENIFSDYAYYFFTLDGGIGKRLLQSGDGNGNSVLNQITESDYLYVYETENINLRRSGREWFGDVLTLEKKTFNVNIPDVSSSSLIKIKSEVAIRTALFTNVNVFLNSDDVPLITHSGAGVDYDGDSDYANISTDVVNISPRNSFTLTYDFIRPQLSSEAWLNYFEIQTKRKLKTVEGQIHFFNSDTKINGNLEYMIEGFNSNFSIWDITKLNEVADQKTFEKDGKAAFITNSNGLLNKYILFKKGSEKIPEMVGKVENQNLHALNPVDFIIITHPDFKAQAEKLAKFHEEKDGYSYLITTADKIYNEFSSGSPDITGIRDFIKMLYDRELTPSKKPKALLLFGDASYDYKGKLGQPNYVPTFESYEYNNAVGSHCSDDYYVILGESEGTWAKSPGKDPTLLDMGVGRLPAKSIYEAEVMVDKCLHYKQNSNRGEWRSSVTFLADDEDFNTHIEDSDLLANLVEKEVPTSNNTKIYFDAFKQVSLGNGNAYPEVNEAINNTINRGTLVFNYLGHGGGSGMGHERVVTRPQILGWKNYDKLTFFITGTCDLAQYDNPEEDSPGELMMNNNEGGAIGMMTTTRKVWIGTNTAFSEVVFKNNLFAKDGKLFMSFGQAYANTKNIMWETLNIRNYVLFGDPLLDLNLPVEKTNILKINGNQVSATSKDTLKALAKIEIEGEVTNQSNVRLTDFNGDVSITLFDKKQSFKTLANDPGSEIFPFSVRNNVLYRGKASVKDGLFKVSFILPKDIDYSIGTGRIYAYAYNDKTDAVGIYDSALIGGTSSSLVTDNQGPDIEIYLEDEKFVNGGIVVKNPLLIVKLWDENGINTAGSGVGREIIAILDKGKTGTKNYILNDFYSTTLNSYQGGEVRYNLSELSPGQHTLNIRAWDVYNNSSENTVEFIVATDENMAIKNLLNYPNPFTTKTTIHFDHNKAGQELKIAINIMSISGKVVKTIFASVPNSSSHISDIEWDGKDEYGQNLARGVYIYNVMVKSEDGKTEQEIQKMVLLK